MPATHASVCSLDCPDTCSLAVTVEAGRITAVDGSAHNPYTAGFICAKVRRYAERVYSPLRLQYPQRRVGRKGAGRFERISWDEAIATIADRFRQIVSSDGPEAIVPYHYGGSNGVFGEGAVDARFFNRLGASELLKTICAAPTGTVARAMYGTMSGVPPEDYSRARAIVLWGVNPSATSIHLVPQVRAALRAGAFVAVVDPRRTPLARSATLHLQPLPGTDVVLALALLNELVRTEQLDHAFLQQHVDGYDEMANAAAEYSAARAAQICDVPEAHIHLFAQAYAAASPAVIRCGWGVERNRNGGNAVRAILALPACAGKFGVRGGGYTMSLSRAFPINAAALGRPDLRPRAARQVNMSQLGRVLTEPQTPPVRALFVYNANPVAMAPNQNLILCGLAREDLFTVVHEQVLTDTARFADILLPATTTFEAPELHKAYGHHYLQYSDAVISPVGESLSNPELFSRLASAMGFDDIAGDASPDALLRSALQDGGERGGAPDAEVLREAKIAPLRFHGQTELVQFGTDFPTTRSGKIELMAPVLGPVRYVPVGSNPYPLVLLSPASSRTINSIFGERPVAATLAIAPPDAVRRGIADGDLVRVYNALGEVIVAARFSHDLRRGVVSLPKGLWRSSTRNGATATALVPDHLTDIGDGACFNDARVEVEKQ